MTKFVTLVDGDGYRGTLNKFVGHVYGNMVTFTLTDPSTAWYFDSAVIEKLADQRYLSLAGTAQATPTVSATNPEQNEHLAVVFKQILPAIERAGLRYWVYGGVGVAGVAGRFHHRCGAHRAKSLDEAPLSTVRI